MRASAARRALAGLAFLIENAATDEMAKSRRSGRRHELILAIRRYNESREAYRRKERGSRTSRPNDKLRH
jgi:hypothetical protein